MRKMWLVLAAVASLLGGAGVVRAAEPTIGPDDRILGKADAPVTIIEYASLTCPHCAAFESETLPKIKSEWIDTGKAKLILRDFPLDGSAVKAAMLARCAPPDKFYGFVDVLFSGQNVWARGADPTSALERVAKLGGMNADQFQTCMKDSAMQDKILASRLTAETEYKVDSTPTFFINGKPMSPNGARPYEDFNKALTDASPK